MPSNQSLHKYELAVENEYGENIATNVTYSVLDASTADEATVYSDRAETAKTIPVTSTVFGTDGGKIIFFSAASSVDITAVTNDGGAVYKRGITPDEGRLIIKMDPGNRHVMMVPFNGADIADTVEEDLGFDVPIGADVSGADAPWLFVDTAMSSATGSCNVGLLSSESGGDVNGFMMAVSLSVAGHIRVNTDATESVGDKIGAVVAGFTPGGSVDGNVALLHLLIESGAARSVVMSADTGASACAGFVCIPFIQTGLRSS